MSDTEQFADRPSTWPSEWWKEQSVAAQLSHCFGQHVLGMGVLFTIDKKPHGEWLTGFLVKIESLTFWLTAKHVIERLNEIRSNQSVKLHKVSWNDGYENPAARCVPFSLNDLPAYTDPHIDFGAVFIQPGYAAPLLANPKVRPLTPEVWFHHETSKPEGYYLVGLPAEWCSLKEVGRSGGQVNFRAEALCACIPLERISPDEADTDGTFWDHPGAFYAKVLQVLKRPNQPLDSIKGMSGGPIVSIERTDQGQLKYRLFGIQSEWFPESRILRAEPMSEVIKIIAGWFAELPNVRESGE